jgi:hypothetical protein
LGVARVAAVLLIGTASLGGLAAYYDAAELDWRETAAELRRAGGEALRAAAARWAPAPDRERVDLPEAADAAAPAREAPVAEMPPPEAPPSEAPPSEAPIGDRPVATAEVEPGRSESSVDEAETAAPSRELPSPAESAPPAAAAESPGAAVVAPVVEAPPSLTLDVPAIAVRENHGAVAIDVIRNGDAGARSSVAWWTTPESADPYDDYASFGTAILEFPPGETQRRVLVPLVDDGLREPDETFVVHLASRPRGATAGRVTATRVTVHDDD